MDNSRFLMIEDGLPNSTVDNTVELSCAYFPENSNFYMKYAWKRPGEPITNRIFTVSPTPFYAGDIIHLAYLWDVNKGIDGQYSIAIYQDGVLVGGISDSLSPQANWAPNMGIAGTWNGGTSGWDGIRGPMDNLKIWNYAKTDFLDRCSEDGSIPCVGSNTAPTISILEPDGAGDNADASYNITWNDSDPEENAQISLYYDTDNAGYDGTLIITGLSEDADGANGSYLWDTSGMPEASYYVYAKIDDSVNPVAYSYSSGRVTIAHAVTNVKPEPPLQLKATAGRDVVNMVWQLSASPDVEKYNIYRSLLSDFQISPDKLIGQVTGDKNTYHDRGLEKDTVYYYMVTAVSSNAQGSEPSNEAWGRPGTKQHNLLLHNNKINPNKGEKIEVKYTVEETSTVKIKIFNIKGKLVYEYPEQTLSAGEYEIQWDGISKEANVVSSGVYVIQLFINGKLKDTKKSLIVK